MAVGIINSGATPYGVGIGVLYTPTLLKKLATNSLNYF